jgi:hypothetical protein
MMKTCEKLLCLIVVVFSFTVKLSAQEMSYQDYISKNAQVFSSDNATIMQEDYDRYKLFIIGEYHFDPSNKPIFLTVLKTCTKMPECER